MPDEEPPFFLVGCERSGTTLLMSYLDEHPDIAVPTESHLFHRFFPFLSGYGSLEEQANLRALVSDMLSDIWIERWELGVGVDDFIAGLDERSFAGCIRRLFEIFLQYEGKLRWGEKTPVHVMYINEILSVFPDAKFIHLVRDGRDVAQSLLKVPHGPQNVWALAKRWRNRIERFELARESLSRDAYIEVKYEDFVKAPQAEMDRILQFLGAAPFRYQFHGVKNKKIDRIKSVIPAHPLIDTPVQEGRVGTYKSCFPPGEIAIFESVAGTQLQRYCYPLETDCSLTPSLPLRAYYYAQGGIYRILRVFPSNAFLLRSSWQLRARKFMRSKRRSGIKSPAIRAAFRMTKQRETLLWQLLGRRNSFNSGHINNLESVCILLGPYRNLSTLFGGLMLLHPSCLVLNHAGQRVFRDRRMNFIDDYSRQKFEKFCEFAFFAAVRGRKGGHGGSITYSHAFETGRLKSVYERRFGAQIRDKPDISCLVWKESYKISKAFRISETSLYRMLDDNRLLRFILPIRNPIDCALSLLETGHANVFDDLPEFSVVAVLDRLMNEYCWFLDWQARYPDRFLHFFQHELHEEKLYCKIAQFLGIECEERWLLDVMEVVELRPSREFRPEWLMTYRQLVQKYFSSRPEMQMQFERMVRQ